MNIQKSELKNIYIFFKNFKIYENLKKNAKTNCNGYIN